MGREDYVNKYRKAVLCKNFTQGLQKSSSATAQVLLEISNLKAFYLLCLLNAYFTVHVFSHCEGAKIA